jgi:hypothetical protein
MKRRPCTIRQALFSALCQQIVVLTLAAMILDGGLIAQVCIFAAIAFWLGVVVIWRRRRANLTRGDTLYIEAGLLPITIAAVFLSFAIWRLRGVMDSF